MRGFFLFQSRALTNVFMKIFLYSNIFSSIVNCLFDSEEKTIRLSKKIPHSIKCSVPLVSRKKIYGSSGDLNPIDVYKGATFEPTSQEFSILSQLKETNLDTNGEHSGKLNEANSSPFVINFSEEADNPRESEPVSKSRRLRFDIDLNEEPKDLDEIESRLISSIEYKETSGKRQRIDSDISQTGIATDQLLTSMKQRTSDIIKNIPEKDTDHGPDKTIPVSIKAGSDSFSRDPGDLHSEETLSKYLLSKKLKQVKKNNIVDGNKKKRMKHKNDEKLNLLKNKKDSQTAISNVQGDGPISQFGNTWNINRYAASAGKKYDITQIDGTLGSPIDLKILISEQFNELRHDNTIDHKTKLRLENLLNETARSYKFICPSMRKSVRRNPRLKLNDSEYLPREKGLQKDLEAGTLLKAAIQSTNGSEILNRLEEIVLKCYSMGEHLEIKSVDNYIESIIYKIEAEKKWSIMVTIALGRILDLGFERSIKVDFERAREVAMTINFWRSYSTNYRINKLPCHSSNPLSTYRLALVEIGAHMGFNRLEKLGLQENILGLYYEVLEAEKRRAETKINRVQIAFRAANSVINKIFLIYKIFTVFDKRCIDALKAHLVLLIEDFKKILIAFTSLEKQVKKEIELKIIKEEIISNTDIFSRQSIKKSEVYLISDLFFCWTTSAYPKIFNFLKIDNFARIGFFLFIDDCCLIDFNESVN
ncbi:hypothetical protein BY996DRAFT_7159270, partial [Phakopsora pachyrhizi]